MNLQTWNHVVWGMSTRTLMTDLRKIKGMEVVKVDTHKIRGRAKIQTCPGPPADGKFHILLEKPSDLAWHIQSLHQVVNSYKTRASLDRTSQTLIDSFKAIYPDLTALVIFPSFKIKTVLKLAGQDIVLPTGITRFTASPAPCTSTIRCTNSPAANPSNTRAPTSSSGSRNASRTRACASTPKQPSSSTNDDGLLLPRRPHPARHS